MSTAKDLTADVNEMVALESRGWGDQRNATERIATLASLPYWTVEYLRIGKTKNPNDEVKLRIKRAAVKILESRVRTFEARLQALKNELAELEEEKAPEDETDLLVLARQIDDLEDQVKARRSRLEKYKRQPTKGA